jgi:hypothetical protein
MAMFVYISTGPNFINNHYFLGLINFIHNTPPAYLIAIIVIVTFKFFNISVDLGIILQLRQTFL